MTPSFCQEWTPSPHFCFSFWDRVSLCSSGWPGTLHEDQDSEICLLLARVLGLPLNSTIPGYFFGKEVFVEVWEEGGGWREGGKKGENAGVWLWEQPCQTTQNCHRGWAARLVMWSAFPCFPTQSYPAHLAKAPLTWQFSYRKVTPCSTQRFQKWQSGILNHLFNSLSSQICFVSIGNVISNCNIHFAQLTLNFRYKWPGFHTIF